MKDDIHRLRTAARPTAVKIAKEANTQTTDDGQTAAAAGQCCTPIRYFGDQPDPRYKKFKGVGSQNCKGHYYLRHWVFEAEPHGDNGQIFKQEGAVYAANSNFEVQAAPVKAARKIRGLQRELCENHADLFPELILACCPEEWASLIGVPQEEIDAQKRMTALLTDAQRSDALEFVLGGVKNSYHGCGLGKMLVEAAIDASRRRGWRFSDVQLVCHHPGNPLLQELGLHRNPCRKPKSR
ncbi:ASPM [Symbiodinium sp. CCMP2456]|nr:ASPM [Symbiodinium sp. CCMP2456]